LKKFITPRDYPHDKCIGLDFVIRLDKINAMQKFSSSNPDNPQDKAIKFYFELMSYGHGVAFGYSCEQQRDEVFDLILKDLNEVE
jgi:hypothetical protein